MGGALGRFRLVTAMGADDSADGAAERKSTAGASGRAEALLERLNYVRGLDGRWRERPTADEAREMQKIAALAG